MISVTEQIARWLHSRLSGIRGAPDYEICLSDVVRPFRQNGFNPEHMLAVLQQDTPERDDENSVAGNPRLIAWRRPFVIDVFVAPSELDQTPSDCVFNSIEASITKAVMDDSAWPNHIIGIDIEPVIYTAASDGSFDGIQLRFDIHYRVAENDPYIGVNGDG